MFGRKSNQPIPPPPELLDNRALFNVSPWSYVLGILIAVFGMLFAFYGLQREQQRETDRGKPQEMNGPALVAPTSPSGTTSERLIFIE